MKGGNIVIIIFIFSLRNQAVPVSLIYIYRFGVCMARKKGRILKVKAGFNPNSSSIGTNLTPLIILGSVVSVALPVISLIVARKLKKKKAEEEKPF